MKITTTTPVLRITIAPHAEAPLTLPLPVPSPSHRSRDNWPKRRTTLTLQTGLVRPVFGQLAHEKTITAVMRQPYSHGGYMALTRAFWQNTTWLERLTRLMPDARARVDALIGARTLTEALPDMMALLENNPVLAAYGTSRAGTSPPAIEWDVWISPSDAQDLNSARVIHGNAVAEDMAYNTPNDARAMMSASIAGSDLHTGPSVLAWKALFEASLAEAGMAREPGSRQALFLDLKSTYSSPADINQFVAALSSIGFDVQGVGTFCYHQLVGLNAAMPVHLFDTADDLVAASRAGTLPKSASAIFNGGFLLTAKRSDPTLFEIDTQALKRVAAVQSAHTLNLAIYIQETRASWQALDCLTRCINANAHIFAMGFAYSGIRGLADSTTAVGRGVKMLYAQAL